MNKNLIISILLSYIVFDFTFALLYYKNNPHIISYLNGNITGQDIIIPLILAIIIGCITYQFIILFT